jgi:hypothetical protein
MLRGWVGDENTFAEHCLAENQLDLAPVVQYSLNYWTKSMIKQQDPQTRNDVATSVERGMTAAKLEHLQSLKLLIGMTGMRSSQQVEWYTEKCFQ